MRWTCSTPCENLQNGAVISTRRSSWNAPIPLRQDSEAPPTQIIAQPFCWASARAPVQIPAGLGGIRGGLLVAQPGVGDPFLLRGRRDRAHREPDDPEHELDALPLEGFRYEGSAVD